MSSTMAVLGALSGAVVCGLAGRFGPALVMEAAVNEEQRQVLRQLFTYGGAYAAAVMALVLLTAFQALPHWTYVAALALWFGALFPALSWAHHRLDAAAGRTIAGPTLSVA
jgi:hypothetical protein